eukprot:3365413-Rhodomonas_salina.2
MPAANQIEIHPICQQKSVNSMMDKKEITKIAYSSLATLSFWRTGEGQGGDHHTAHLRVACQKVTQATVTRLGV